MLKLIIHKQIKLAKHIQLLISLYSNMMLLVFSKYKIYHVHHIA